MADLIPNIIKHTDPADIVKDHNDLEHINDTAPTIIDAIPVEREELIFTEEDIIRDIGEIEKIDASDIEYAMVRKPSPHKKTNAVLKKAREKGKAAKVARRHNRKK